MIKRYSITLLLIAVILTQTACGLSGRVAKAVASLPDVVRVLVPNAGQTVFTVLDSAATAFKEFADNKTVSRWEKAEGIWKNSVKPALLAFNNATLNKIIAGVDVLMGQVTLPVGVTGSGGGADTSSDRVITDFKEDDVKALEKLIDSVK